LSQREDLLHDLSDRLNGILISVELAIALLDADQPTSTEITSVLARVRDDCGACAELLSGLRRLPSA
jgi:hypothetical protein